MAEQFHVALANEDDLPRIAEIQHPFRGHSRETVTSFRDAVWTALLSAMRYHNVKVIKCVHTERTSGEQTIISCAAWIFWTRHRPAAEYLQIPPLSLPNRALNRRERENQTNDAQDSHDHRVRWMAGRPHALLFFLDTDKDWRGLGAATRLVEWGLRQCQQWNIPAYLEPTAKAAHLYERLGFEFGIYFREDVPEDEDRDYAVMIWWPPGMPMSDKTKAWPDYVRAA